MSQHTAIPTTCLILSDIDFSDDDHDDVDDTTVLLHNDRYKSQSKDNTTASIVFSRSKSLCSLLVKTLLVPDIDDVGGNAELDDYYRSICKNNNSTFTCPRSQYNNKELHSLLASTIISNDHDDHLEYGGEKKCLDLHYTTYRDRVMDDDDDVHVLSPHYNMNSNDDNNLKTELFERVLLSLDDCIDDNDCVNGYIFTESEDLIAIGGTRKPIVANAAARSATYDDDDDDDDNNNDDVQYKNRYSSSTIDTVVLRLDGVDSEYSGRTTLYPYLSSASSSSSYSRRVHHDGDDHDEIRRDHIVPNRPSKMISPSQISRASKISRDEENHKKRSVWRNTSPNHSSIQHIVNVRSRPHASPTLRALSPTLRALSPTLRALSPTLRALSPRDHQQAEKNGSLATTYNRLPNKLRHESLPTSAMMSSLLQTKDIDVVVRSSPLPSVTSSLTTQSPERSRTNKYLNRNNQHIHTNNTSIHPNIKSNQVREELAIKPGATKFSRNKSSFLTNTFKDSQLLSSSFIQQKVANYQFISKSRKDHQQLSKELMNNDMKRFRKSRSTSPVKLKSSDNNYISVLKEKFLKSTNVQYHHHCDIHHHHQQQQHQQQHQHQRDVKRRSRSVPSMNRHVNISSSNYPQQPLAYIKNNVNLDVDESHKQGVSLISSLLRSNNRNGCYLLGAKSNRATAMKSTATTGSSSRSSLKK
jgi:hypothetical protein